MRKLLCIALIGLTLNSGAQDFKNVSKLVLLNQFEPAKIELDKLLTDSKAEAKPNGWFFKFKIYAAFYKDDKLRVKYPNSETIADDAFKKYLSLDSSIKFLRENNGQDALYNMYATSFNKGIVTFNDKNWDSAYYYFSFAVKYSDVIFQNKFSTNKNQAFDTTSILYAGYSAQNSKKQEVATSYYDRLISNKIGGKSYLDIYKYSLVYCINTKNQGLFNKYLSASKVMYPAIDYPSVDWEDYELSYFNKNYTLQQKSDLYDKDDAAGTISAKRYLQYGDAFARISKEESAGLDSLKQDSYLRKAAEAFKKAFYKEQTNGISAFNAGVIYYNLFGIYDDKASQARRALQELNSSAETDPKKKASPQFKAKAESLKNQRITFEKPLNEAADSSVLWLEKEYAILKDKKDRSKEENNCLGKSVDYLSNIFMFKRDKVRGKDLKAFDEYDAKFKVYDALHGKF